MVSTTLDEGHKIRVMLVDDHGLVRRGFLVVLVLAATHVLNYWMNPILAVFQFTLGLLMIPFEFLLR